MKKTRINKIFALLLLLLIIIDIVSLFIIFYNSVVLKNSIYKYSFIYILFALLPVLSILLFFTGIWTKQETKSNKIELSQSKEIEEKEMKIESKDKEDEEKKEEEEISVDVSEFVKKVMPRITPTIKIERFTEKLLSNLAKEFNLTEGLLFLKASDKSFKISGLYAYYKDTKPEDFKEGEGLCGQVVKDKKLLNIKNVPENYITVVSGLGEGTPKHMLIVPVMDNNTVVGLLELASFNEFDDKTEAIFNELSKIIAENLTNIKKTDKSK